ncbi:anti-sigma factor [Actinotalea sp. M2MS4P-6]|uniref:anti-sigma factor n=1 Tax=Actinotalea sp. M2MS4P-6 TaxID=2983762 RepID=UPI0021E440BC|nr:anti-sigma factor [Actinotalea sp. M2MS4P-6]MCV2396062.1 anti-sigma factor [Actinotalea sp. M2MS4P-6]
MSETNLHALTGAYVLDALDPEERAAFEAHLPACTDCTAEVTSLREATSRMAAAESVAPPPALRDAVLEQVRRTPQVPPLVPNRAPAGSSAGRARRRAAARWASWPTVAVAASIAVLLAVGGTLLVQAQRADRASEQLQAEVMKIVSAPDMVSHDLGLGASHLVMSEDMDAAAVMGSDVPMPDSGMVYQVWMMHGDGSMVAGPTFMPRDGDVTALVEGDLSDVAAFMVTEEPSGGSEEPTGEYLAELHL